MKGDERLPLIAAASIIARVWRDRLMVRLAAAFPRYGFEIHKGYGTRAHRRALRRYGPSPVHRRSFLKWLTNDYILMTNDECLMTKMLCSTN